MWKRAIAVLNLLVLLAVSVWAVDGTFQGKVIDPPSNLPKPQGWIYVQGRNHMLRRVEVSHASIVFSSSVPDNQHHKCGVECLTPGQEVRVTAEQDRSGEWRAKRIEIIRVTTNRT